MMLVAAWLSGTATAIRGAASNLPACVARAAYRGCCTPASTKQGGGHRGRCFPSSTARSSGSSWPTRREEMASACPTATIAGGRWDPEPSSPSRLPPPMSSTGTWLQPVSHLPPIVFSGSPSPILITMIGSSYWCTACLNSDRFEYKLV
jgi:hypothetical protein